MEDSGNGESGNYYMAKSKDSSSSSRQHDTSDSAYVSGSASESASESAVSDRKEIEEYKERVLRACQYGRLVDVRELAAGKKIPLKNCIAKSAHGDTPLHVAAYFGHKNIVEYMIVEEEFDVEIKNSYDNTPLHRAANQGHLNVVKYLVEEKKSDPMAVCRWRRTPLHNACKNGRLGVVKYLMSDSRVDASAKDTNRKQTPLQMAAQEGTVEVVQYIMMKNGVGGEESGPYTLLHLAAFGGKLDIVRYLIQERKYDPMIKDFENKTPLHSACTSGQLEVAKFLVDKYKVDVYSSESRYQESPLGTAAMHGKMDIVKYLVEDMKCIIEHGNGNENTPIHSAAWEGSLDVIKYFIDDKKCSPSCKGRKGRTPLHSACYNGKSEVVDYLLDHHRVDVSCRDHDGATPLHLAAKGGYLPLVQQLVRKYRCDYTISDVSGKTPLDYAAAKNHTNTIKYLRKVHTISSDSSREQLAKELKEYILSCRPTGIVLGKGAYSRVIELKLESDPSVTLAGKVFKTSHLSGKAIDYHEKLKKEFEIMVQLKNSNIVAYKGVCFQPDAMLPLLVMERMMTSLHDYLLKSDNSGLPVERKVSFLLDTASGLEYLHSHTPAIIHRDLTAKNMLLDSQLRAKIADFGNSRIMKLRPLFGHETMTNEPGTLAYMPPEASGEHAHYGPSLDVFSFGHLSLFTVIQSQVHPLLPHNYTDSVTGILHARSEVERREEFIRKAKELLSEDHFLLNLITQCLSNLPKHRPSTAELVTRLKTAAETTEDRASSLQPDAQASIPPEDSSDLANHRDLEPTNLRSNGRELEDTDSDTSQRRSQKDSEFNTSSSTSVSQQVVAIRDKDGYFTGASDIASADESPAPSQATSWEKDNTGAADGPNPRKPDVQTHSDTLESSSHEAIVKDSAADGRTPAETNSDMSQEISQKDSRNEDTSISTTSEDPQSGVQSRELGDGDDYCTKTDISGLGICASMHTPVFPVIRGADIVARTAVEITPDQPLDFHWEGHGFKVHIPAGAIRRERGRVTLRIQASLSVDYQLPDDGVLVSGVYWLSLHPHVERFDKKVTISLQHCAAHEGSQLSFVMAKNTPEAPSTKLLGGSFFSEKFGSVEVESFSGVFVIIENIINFFIRKFYALQVYYRRKDDQVRITVTEDLPLHLLRVRDEYKEWEMVISTTAIIDKDEISLLDTPSSEANGWELSQLKPSKIKKAIIDNFRPGGEIPYFAIAMKSKCPTSSKITIYFGGVEGQSFLAFEHPKYKVQQDAREPECHADGFKRQEVQPGREPVEITALRTNLRYITDTVAIGGSTLQWFANSLVEGSFTTHEAAQGILNSEGKAPAGKASELMASVFAKIHGTDEKQHWFNKFVKIFSEYEAYSDICKKLQQGIN